MKNYISPEPLNGTVATYDPATIGKNYWRLMEWDKEIVTQSIDRERDDTLFGIIIYVVLP